MSEVFDPHLKARLSLDETQRVRGINHVDEYWESSEGNTRGAAMAYLRHVAATLAVPEDQFSHAHQPVNYYQPVLSRGTEYRASEEKSLFDGTTEAFYQTHRNVPVWAAGVTVTVKKDPLRVVSAVNTSLDGLDAELPSDEVIERWRGLFAQAAAEQPKDGFSQPADQPESADFVGELVAGRAFRRPKRRTTKGERQQSRARILSGRFFIYRYDPQDRLPHDKPAVHEPQGPDLMSDDAFQALKGDPTLPLPPVDERIRAGADYLVGEVIFEYETPDWGDINWRALVELESGSILYLRGLSAAVNGLVFLHDPVTESGLNSNGSAATTTTLNPFRDDVLLPNLNAPIGGVQSLAGARVTLSEQETPTVAAPTRAGVDFDYDSRTNDFAAVNAYFHVERFFQLVQNMGFPPSYWGGTTFPVPVDHRGLGDAINAHCVGNGFGIAHLCYALANANDTANPIGIATDWRVHLHELGGHGILHSHVGGPNFGFSHSAGDSMAVILVDPESQAPDRFLLTPFVNVPRRHDRPVATWAWGGPNDIGGYSSEQILSTTLFRVYQSIGGDAADIGRRRFAARYMAYLILRSVGTLTPITNPANALAFANSMLATDLLNWTSEGLSGGAYGKVLRWSFEKQGLFQTGNPAPGSVTTAGQPPAVDVYIDDGRGGEYPYQPIHWHTTTIWNRTSADGGTTHQEPILNATNYAYAKVKNRGTQVATNVVVRGFHTKPMAGLLWPGDFEPFATPQLSVGALSANNSEEKLVGPFEWEPNLNAYGHDCMLVIVSSAGDPSNIDNFGPGETIAEWRLVPNDNNVGQRNVMPVPGGGGLNGLVAGMHGFPLWIGNPNPRPAVVDIDVHMPKLLAERGWRLSFEGLRGTRLTLKARAQRGLTLAVLPGTSFSRGEVEGTDDRDIVITAKADGGTLGGMTYRLDPAIDHPRNPLNPSPAGKDLEQCKLHAARLLDCLNLHGHDVHSVRIKKVTIDVAMEGDCD